jgi:serine/threonine protein kinase
LELLAQKIILTLSRADFGISKKFADNMSQTDGLIAKSRKYCSPEVYDGEPQGRAADVFSLGCVFLEMATILCNISLDEFAEHRSQDTDGDDSFHDNLRRVEEWIELFRMTIQMSLEQDLKL